ncbi:MAG: hypothetical protein H6977_15700 [Gammaproteobacteria bacterium]|nr:hypothetical protein [Gammaproteobacteria bacterium]MCP5201447.1 hypothetical protein [Gammaproteobacteria bacterium]
MPQIEQVQITFVPAEDRLLLRVSSGAAEEFRFWLTRRFVVALRPQLTRRLSGQDHIRVQASSDARRELLDFERQRAVSTADFKTPFKASPRSFPLGEQPILLTRFTLRPRDDGAIALTLAPEQGAGIDLALTPALVHSVLALLDTALDSADWQLGDAAAPVLAADAPPATLN